MSKSFNQLISQLQGRQRFQSGQTNTVAGMDIEGERQDIEASKSDYFTDVEEANRQMAKKAKRRGRWGAFGTLLGSAASFTPLGALGGALIGGLASSLGRSAVKPYSGTISSSLPGGKFYSQARKDFSRDIASTNQFISDANEGQSLLDMTNSLGDALNIYGLQDKFGDDVRGMFAGGKERKAMRGLEKNYGDDIQERLLGSNNV